MPRSAGRMLLVVAGLAIGVILLVGCEDDGLGVLRSCTLVGCDSGVVVHLGDLATTTAETLTVELCVDEECTEQRVEPGGSRIVGLYREPDRWAPDETVRATVRITDGRGSVITETDRDVTLERHEPNGPECPPTCAQARIDL